MLKLRETLADNARALKENMSVGYVKCLIGDGFLYSYDWFVKAKRRLQGRLLGINPPKRDDT